MGSPTIFSGKRTKLLSVNGILNSDGSINDNNGMTDFIKNGHAEVNNLGWTTYNGVKTALALNDYDMIYIETGIQLTTNNAIKILSVSTPCGLTVGGTYYAIATGPNHAFLFTSPGAEVVPITADATITFSEIRPRLNDGTANITWTTTSTNPLSGSNSFLLTKDAANRQYQGVMNDFTIDNANKGKMLNITFDYILNSGTFVAGTPTTDSDLIVYLYDITNARLIEPSSFKLVTSSTTVPDKFNAYFQTSIDSTSYRLIFHVATTNTAAWALKVDNISVSPTQLVGGTIITDWESYTSTISNAGSGTFSQSFKQRRVGSNLEVQGIFTTTNPGTGSNIVTASLPAGLTVDTSVIPAFNESRSFGSGNFLSSSSRYPAVVVGGNSYTPGNNTVAFLNSLTNTVLIGSNFAASTQVGFLFSVPILGWSAGAQMSDGYDGRVVVSTMDVTNAATGNLPSSVDVVLKGNASLDKTNSLNASAGTFTVPSAGVYEVSAFYSLNSAANGPGNQITASLWIDNVYYQEIDVWNSSSYTERIAVNGTFKQIELRAGQVLTVKAFQATGITRTINSGALTFKKLSGAAFMTPTAKAVLRYTTSAGQTINTGTAVVRFGTKDYDSIGGYNTATGVFTAQESGEYKVTTKMFTAGASYSTVEDVEVLLYKNGSVFSELDRKFGNGSVIPLSVGGSDTVQLNAGETCAIFIYSAISNTLLATAFKNYLTIEKVK